MNITFLPAEILLGIFSSLSYEDLKLRVAPTCKLFKCLVDNAQDKLRSGELSVVLARDKPTEEDYSQEELSQIDAGGIVDHPHLDIGFEIHEILKPYMLMAGKDPWTVEDVRFRKGKRKPLFSSTIANEMAISPSVTKLGLSLTTLIYSSTPLFVSNPSGVTVMDVMHTWVEIKKELKRRVRRTESYWAEWPGAEGYKVQYKDGVVILLVC